MLLFQILALALFGTIGRRGSLHRSPFPRLDGGRTIADRSLFLTGDILHGRAVNLLVLLLLLLVVVVVVVVVVIIIGGGGRAGHVNTNVLVVVLCMMCRECGSSGYASSRSWHDGKYKLVPVSQVNERMKE